MPKRRAVDSEVVVEEALRKSSGHKKSKKMAPSATLQRQYIDDVMQVTRTDSKTAAKLLAKANWNVTVAITNFFNNPSSTASNPARKALDQIFDKYRTNPKDTPNELDITATSKILETLDFEVGSIPSLYFFEFTKSPSLGLIPREGFTSGPFLDANCDSLDKIKQHILSQLLSAHGTLEQYKAVYNHTFGILIEAPKKAIDLETAVDFWKILTDEKTGFPWVAPSGLDFLPLWLEFLESKWQKAVNRDLWRQTLAFMVKAKEDESLGFWSEESSWPSVIDDFVQWVKVEKRGEAMEE